MFAAWCPTHGSEVLLSESRIRDLELRPDEVVIRFTCWCGTEGTVQDPRLRRAHVAGSAPDVALAADDELGRGELAQPQRTPRVQLLRADADLGPEPELFTVDEAS